MLQLQATFLTLSVETDSQDSGDSEDQGSDHTPLRDEDRDRQGRTVAALESEILKYLTNE